MVGILQSITNKNFDDYIHSIDRCINSLDSVNFILNSYKIIRDKPEEGINLLIGQLSGISANIELEKSYRLFCELIGAKYSVNNKEVESIPLFPLAQALTPQTFPFYPWQNIDDNNFLVYEDDIEQSYFMELEKSKDKKVDDSKHNSFQYEFDKKLISILNEMKKFPRSKEVLNLYQTFLLVKDLQTNEDLKQVFNEYKVLDFKSPFLNRENSKVDEELYKKRKEAYANKPKELFLQHFYQMMKILKSEGRINFKLDMDDLKWIILQNKLSQFGGKLLKIKDDFKSTLSEINNFSTSKDDKEKEFNQLCKDVYTFFESRDLDYSDDIKKFPSARKISGSRPGGPGILKRINKYGGLTKFKKKYYAYLNEMKAKNPLNIIEDTFWKKTNNNLDIDKLIELRENLKKDLDLDKLKKEYGIDSKSENLSSKV